MSDENDQIVAAINELRYNEGATVLIPCDNPDFNDLPNCFVEVTDEWTGWEPIKFAGNTLLAALKIAVEGKREYDEKTRSRP